MKNVKRKVIFYTILTSFSFHIYCIVTAITKTSNRHDSIKENIGALSDNERFQLTTYDNIPQGKVFENVVFCAPPSGFEDYSGAVKDAITKLWAGPKSGGAFVFTSSGGM